jgi:DNA replication and repair protein RecF
MGVFLKELRLQNFRSHLSFSLDDPQHLIIIIGANATGKTNIIEAIQLLSMLESFKAPLWQDVVNDKEENCLIQARYVQNERLIDIQMDVREGRRSYLLNGKKKAKNLLKGIVPAVIFVPDDLDLAKDSSEVRRRLLDDMGQQLSSSYREISTDYQRTVRQRNAVLKMQKEEPCPRQLLESWNENLVALGSLLFVSRVRLYRRLCEKALEHYKELSEGEALTSRYIPSFSRLDKEYDDEALFEMEKEEVRELLQESCEFLQREEQARAKTLVGPHRDEIAFFVDGRDARRYASQGQQRSIALALKLAQLGVVQDISESQPLLLLDDVMSELDESRRHALVEMIDGQMQTVITATDLSCFDEDMIRHAQIVELGGTRP